MGSLGFVVSGTDTNVGKTWVASAIVRSLLAAGKQVAVYKPVASGHATPGCAGSDARTLWEAAGCPGRLDDVCPQSFEAALPPVASARVEGRAVDEALLRSGLAALPRHDVVIVEGAGGLFSPVGQETLVVDLVRDFNLPLVIVDAARLGAVGRSLATIRAARAEGLAVAAVVLSHTHPVLPGDVGPLSAISIAKEAASSIAARGEVAVAILGHGQERLPEATEWLARLSG